MNDEQHIPFDAECPWCHEDSDAGERFDGEDFRCGHCGRHVVAVCFVDEDEDDNRIFHVLKVERGPADTRTHHQRNQARKQLRGWR